jgi:hypothetical protein
MCKLNEKMLPAACATPPWIYSYSAIDYVFVEGIQAKKIRSPTLYRISRILHVVHVH